MTFEILYEDGKARVGKLYTEHGPVITPFFMPVASKGSVKAMEGADIDILGFESIISNSFILSLSPGIDVVEGAGGIHKFMHFKKNIFTDSGGFQVLSKDFLIKKTDEGALFKDQSGKKMIYTPEIAMKNQIRLGSDVAMTLDDVAHYGLSGKEYVDAIRRTHDWARRSIIAHKELKKEYDSKQLLFGIAQGGTREEYRRFSTHKINEMDFDGVALGGLVIGESRGELMGAIAESVKHFDDHKVRYLMGLGSPPDVVRAVGEGVDCFDSIYPTSNARHGSMLTRKGRFMIKKVAYKNDHGPIEEGCKCETCKNYSRAYLHHLLRTHELLGYKLATIHNLHFMNNLIHELRDAIKKGRYKEYAEDFLKDYFSGKEAKEFSNNVQQKYMEKLRKEQAKIFLDWKGE
ncbi:tRNA guanosine(34) transglycosylase Tgt [Candidatus Woesearchaeota archaeon]|nr:tRNA guanosine(34) transglycosylase Tgt [Candidatus Woesearchaeota archaeon]